MSLAEPEMLFRIGFGFDVHAFANGRRLILGGIDIPHEYGLDGHSDADVLTHAVIDAVLGAMGMGDIGKHFPDTSDDFKDADSMGLLFETIAWMKKKGFKLNNLDSTIIAQTPKLAPYIAGMEDRFAVGFDASKNQINVKATTTEHLGFTGRKEGIAACAIVSLIGNPGFLL